MRMLENKGTCKECGLDFVRLASHVQKEHGSYRDYLLKHEHGGAWPTCACGVCGQRVEFRMTGVAGFREFIHGHHARGKKMSEETKRKIGEKNSENMTRYLAENHGVARERADRMRAGVTDESCRQRSESLKTTFSSMTAEERDEKFGKRMRDRWASGEMTDVHARSVMTFQKRIDNGTYRESGGLGSEKWKQAISTSITEKYLSGGFEWSRGQHVSSKTGGTCYYRSSWELRHMRALDSDPSVRTWEYEPFYLEYELDGRTRKYLPDFVVTFTDEHVELQEVGVGTLKRESQKNVAKASAARSFCQNMGWTHRLVTFEENDQESSLRSVLA